MDGVSAHETRSRVDVMKGLVAVFRSPALREFTAWWAVYKHEVVNLPPMISVVQPRLGGVLRIPHGVGR